MGAPATRAKASSNARARGGAPPPARAGLGIAGEELLAFPAQHLNGLPVSVRIDLQATGINQPIHWASEPIAVPTDGVFFDADEVRAIAIGVQSERLWPSDFKGFCLLKRHDPSVRVTEALALGGAQPDRGAPWSLGRVLRWLELELVDVELLAEHVAAARSRAA
jgi:hypothetical protein